MTASHPNGDVAGLAARRNGRNGSAPAVLLSATQARLFLPRTSIAPALARAGLRPMLAGLPRGRRTDVQLLATELVSNAVLHSGTTTDDIGVFATNARDRVHVEVVDSGPGFSLKPRTPQPRAGPPAKGWGLFLVERLASRWGMEREGNRTKVWFELDAA